MKQRIICVESSLEDHPSYFFMKRYEVRELATLPRTGDSAFFGSVCKEYSGEPIKGIITDANQTGENQVIRISMPISTEKLSGWLTSEGYRSMPNHEEAD